MQYNVSGTISGNYAKDFLHVQKAKISECGSKIIKVDTETGNIFAKNSFIKVTDYIKYICMFPKYYYKSLHRAALTI